MDSFVNAPRQHSAKLNSTYTGIALSARFVQLFPATISRSSSHGYQHIQIKSEEETYEGHLNITVHDLAHHPYREAKFSLSRYPQHKDGSLEYDTLQHHVKKAKTVQTSCPCR